MVSWLGTMVSAEPGRPARWVSRWLDGSWLPSRGRRTKHQAAILSHQRAGRGTRETWAAGNPHLGCCGRAHIFRCGRARVCAHQGELASLEALSSDVGRRRAEEKKAHRRGYRMTTEFVR